MKLGAVTARTAEENPTKKKVPSRPLPSAQERAIACARTAADLRGRDVLVLDMRGVVKWTDYLVLATGGSRRQITSISDRIEEALEDLGDRRIGQQGYAEGSWVVLDFGDIVVHLFNDEKRKYYELEHLWGDAVPVDWERGGNGARVAPGEHAQAEVGNSQVSG